MFAAITETGLPEDLLTLVQRVREVQIGHEAVAGQAGGKFGKRGELQLNLNSTTVGARGVYMAGVMATLAAAAVNCFNEFPMQIA